MAHYKSLEIKSSVADFVAELAERHGIRYERTQLDDLADTFTRLSGDDVPAFDGTSNLLVALKRARVIDGATMGDLLMRHLHEKDTEVMHALYTLSDYPVLAALAAKRTQADKLDGRACQAIYNDALLSVWQSVSEREREFMRRLGVEGSHAS